MVRLAKYVMVVRESTHKAKRFNDLPMVCDVPLICHRGVQWRQCLSSTASVWCGCVRDQTVCGVVV